MFTNIFMKLCSVRTIIFQTAECINKYELLLKLGIRDLSNVTYSFRAREANRYEKIKYLCKIKVTIKNSLVSCMFRNVLSGGRWFLIFVDFIVLLNNFQKMSVLSEKFFKNFPKKSAVLRILLSSIHTCAYLARKYLFWEAMAFVMCVIGVLFFFDRCFKQDERVFIQFYNWGNFLF